MKRDEGRNAGHGLSSSDRQTGDYECSPLGNKTCGSFLEQGSS